MLALQPSGNHPAIKQFVGYGRGNLVYECNAHLCIAVEKLHKFYFLGARRCFLTFLLLQLLTTGLLVLQDNLVSDLIHDGVLLRRWGFRFTRVKQRETQER